MWIKPAPAPAPETVSCETCKHIIFKRDAQEIEHQGYIWSLYFSGKRTRYYCPEHKRNYSSSSVDNNHRTHYYKEMEVDENGVPVGYVKEEKKTVSGIAMPKKTADKKYLAKRKYYLKHRVSTKPYKPQKRV